MVLYGLDNGYKCFYSIHAVGLCFPIVAHHINHSIVEFNMLTDHAMITHINSTKGGGKLGLHLFNTFGYYMIPYVLFHSFDVFYYSSMQKIVKIKKNP